jgi:lipopolysaccharide transport system ATP-binding protein
MDVIVKAENITVDFPIYGTRSLKNEIITGVTGGRINMSTKTTTIRALDNISFEFKRGERIGFWGHNGSGKTTLLRIIAGIYKPSGGFIQINGSVSSLLNISLGMDPDATGIENINLRAAMMGLSNKIIKEKIDEIIQFSELGEYIKFPMKTYSSGMQMRLAFAISTCVESDIIIMDEWLSVGDVEFQEKAQLRLNSLLTSSSLLVLASHDRAFLENNCNRIICMEHGSISEVAI